MQLTGHRVVADIQTQHSMSRIRCRRPARVDFSATTNYPQRLETKVSVDFCLLFFPYRPTRQIDVTHVKSVRSFRKSGAHPHRKTALLLLLWFVVLHLPMPVVHAHDDTHRGGERGLLRHVARHHTGSGNIEVSDCGQSHWHLMLLWEWWQSESGSETSELSVAAGWALHNDGMVVSVPAVNGVLHWIILLHQSATPEKRLNEPAWSGRNAPRKAVGGFLFCFRESVPCCALTGVNLR